MEGQRENMDGTLSPVQREGNETESRYEALGGERPPGRRRIGLTKPLLLGGAAGLILIGALLFFSNGGLGSGAVAMVNGEEVTRKEFLTRLDRIKRFYESRYGKDLFRGEAGRDSLSRLKADLLDEITTEKLLLQEARAAGYTSAPMEEIDQQIEAIKKRSGLSEADLSKMMGQSIQEVKGELRDRWIISQFIKEAVLKGEEPNAELRLRRWLAELKAKAKIVTYEKWEPFSNAQASCCANGGGCGGRGNPQPLDPEIEREAKAKGLEYYESKARKKGADARVTNFGCHIQVDIIEEGKVVLSLTYKEGEIEEI